MVFCLLFLSWALRGIPRASAQVPWEPLLCLLPSCEIGECQPCWLSELDVWGAYPSRGSLKSWSTKCAFQTFHSSERSCSWGFPPYCMVLCQEWGLWQEHVSPFPTHFDVVIFSITGCVGTQLDSGFLSKEIVSFVAVHSVCPLEAGKSRVSCVSIWFRIS